MQKCYICKKTKPKPEMMECNRVMHGNIIKDFICKDCYLKANPCESCKEYDGEYGHCFVDIEKDSLPENCPLKNGGK